MASAGSMTEAAPDAARIVSDCDVLLAHHVELLEAVGMLRILDVTNVLRQGHMRSLEASPKHAGTQLVMLFRKWPCRRGVGDVLKHLKYFKLVYRVTLVFTCCCADLRRKGPRKDCGGD